ncbi:MAG TPA: hypothetical protein EYP90_08575 [Chromatiaceae bacterium]|nr:hypothetical protein [Chromatiaceae bacterium]
MTGGEGHLPGAIDVHVHTPDIFNVLKLNVDESRRLLLREMREAGVRAAFLYAIEANHDHVIRSIGSRDLFRALEEVVASGFMRMPVSLLRVLHDLEGALIEHGNAIKTLYTPTELVVKVAQGVEGLIPVGSIDVSRPLDEVAERLDEVLSLGGAGVKILPTIQLVDERLYDRLELIADMLERRNRILFLHTGCDPGIWELPRFCRYADPSRFERIVRSHRDLTTVLCHMGSYSALSPGVFLEEALRLARRYRNVYLDTAAVDPRFVVDAVRSVGHHKLLFGSDYPVVSSSWRSLVSGILNLELPREVKRAILFDNPLRLLLSTGFKPPFQPEGGEPSEA